MPTNTKRLPTQRLNHCLNRSPAPSRVLIRAVDQATSKFQIVPLKSKIAPRNKKANGFDGASDKTNCGRNARKNSATLGIKTFVSNPWKKMPSIEASRLPEATAGEQIELFDHTSEPPSST